MITIDSNINSSLLYPLEIPYQVEDLVFFDIETTGFSPETSYLYLIGCMYYKEDSWYLKQWLLEDIRNEKELLIEFTQFIKSYKEVIHFNGSGFDIPYILKKCKHYGLINPFSHIESFDIYKKLLPFRKYLPVHSLKLHHLQQFAGYKRKDTYNGGDLISVYTSFVGRNQYESLMKQSLLKGRNIIKKEGNSSTTVKELSDILLLHNLEDIEGLLSISSLLYYVDFFENIPIYETVTTSFLPDDYIVLESALPFTLLAPVCYQLPLISYSSKGKDTVINPYYYCNFHLSLEKNTCKLILPMYKGELKYYYPNYKDYYYLPMEDTAIHKSVAEFVDKEYRVKAKPSNCYNKKDGIFIPFVPPNKADSEKDETFFPSPNFLIHYGDKISFYELDLNLYSINPSLLYHYMKKIVNFIIINKDTVLDFN